MINRNSSIAALLGVATCAGLVCPVGAYAESKTTEKDGFTIKNGTLTAVKGLSGEVVIPEDVKKIQETKTFDDKYYCGRTYMDIPEEDGLVFIPNKKPNLENTWIKTKITNVKNYDLIGEEL